MKIQVHMADLKKRFEVYTEDERPLGCVVFSPAYLPFKKSVQITAWHQGPRKKEEHTTH